MQFVDIHMLINTFAKRNKDTEPLVSEQRYRVPCVQTKTQFFMEKTSYPNKDIEFLPGNTMPQTAHITCATCPHSRLPCHLCKTVKSDIMHPAQHTCYMALHAQSPTPATGDHWAVIDSGTSKHVLLEHIYLANATEDHTAVAGFSGQTSRATHRDAIRTLYSVRKSLQSGNTTRSKFIEKPK